MDERAPLVDRGSDLPSPRAEPRRRNVRHAVPAPESRVPAVGRVLPAADRRHAATAAAARRGRAGAAADPPHGAERGPRGADRPGPQADDGRDPEGPAQPEPGAELRVLSQLSYWDEVSQSNFGRLRSASAILRPQASRSCA